MKRYTLLSLLIALTLPLWAQVRVSVSAPTEVVEGDRFRVAYTVNTTDIDDFSVSDFEGMDVLYGPTRSTSSSYSIVNGKMSSSVSVTFTYTVSAVTAGTFHLPVATVKSGDNTVRSNSPSLTILPGGSRQAQGGQAQSRQADRMRTQDAGERITNKDLFIAVTASKRRVFEQEAILLTYKLYTLVSVSEMSGKMPELDGFHVQELNRTQQPQLKMEHYQGRNYGAAVWKQYVVFPQQTGQLTIPEIKFEATVIQQQRSMDPFEAFFGGGSTMVEVKKTVVAPAVTLQVDALPAPRPDNFSGAVGRFIMSSTLTPTELKANDATTMRVTINGTGNMKLMKAPEVAWPKDFERYDPKQEDRTQIGATGTSGTVIFDYIAVPRHQGHYEVPAVEFCYFDPEARAYKTLTTEAYTMEVAKGSGGGTSGGTALTKEEIELLGSDIRHIKQGAPAYQHIDSPFFGSASYWGIYGLALVVFGIVVYVFRRNANAAADVVGQRGRKATRAATRRLRAARKLMAAGNATAFYEETMRALWGYVADKMNIAVSELSKDNVRGRLAERQVPADVVEQLCRTLDDCEFARYAPGDPQATMDKIYASAEEVINSMDAHLRH